MVVSKDHKYTLNSRGVCIVIPLMLYVIMLAVYAVKIVLHSPISLRVMMDVGTAYMSFLVIYALAVPLIFYIRSATKVKEE